MNGRANFVGIAGAMQGDMKEEISQSAAEPQGSAKPGHELALWEGLSKTLPASSLIMEELHSASRFEIVK